MPDIPVSQLMTSQMPVEPKAPLSTEATTASGSASAMAMTAFLPPISQVTFAPRLAATVLR